MPQSTNDRNVAFTPAWFEEAFKHAETPIPEDIRKTAVRIIETHDIRGICDPMYIANVIAFETGRGDGRGTFEQGGHVYVESREPLLDKLAKRLAGSYGCSRGVTADAIRQALIEQLAY